MSFDTIINDYILENKDLIQNYICQKNSADNCCSYYITKGKYKNSVCKRKIFKNGYCKVHSKYLIESTEVSINTEKTCIDLIQFEYKGQMYFKTKDNIVYGNTDRGHYPIGYFDEERQIIILDF